MFDIGFTQLLLVGVVALVVLGPERLPRVARTIGHLLGRAQRYVGDVKSDIQREMELDQLKDLKGQMEEAAKSVKSSVKDATDTLRDPLADARKALKETTDSVESIVKSTQDDLDAISKSAQQELDELTETVDEIAASSKASPDSQANQTVDSTANPTAATTPPSDTGLAAAVKQDADTPQTSPDDKSAAASALSDTELADRRLAQATAPADTQTTNPSDHDKKPGTPL